ncbi:MAG TPA: AMP-binding protein [Thermodesulfobacteriota bacterium]|nr:AMP-binding protein [Thermodesulfobacteriota bacterium]
MATEMGQSLKDKGDTWPKILTYNCEKYGDHRRAMRHKRFGIWQPYTWEDYYLNVKYLALGLLSLGFEPGDKLLISGDNAPQWYYAELAAQANRGVSAGVYSDLTPPEIKYIARNSEASMAVVEDQEQVDKFLQIKNDLPLLKKIIFWNYKGLAHYDDPTLMGYREVLKLGEKYEAKNPGLFERNVETGKEDDICALVYTSGATGLPKGAVHTYKTMRAGAETYLNLDPWYQTDNVVPYLPPAWMTEQWVGIGCHLLSASVLNFAEAPETQQRDMREIHPNIVVYGARIWESQAAALQAQIDGADAVQRFIFRLLMPIGYKVADLMFQKKKPNPMMKLLRLLADAALFRPIRSDLGLSKARICYTTGATLSSDAFRFYHALGLPLKSLYGTTEGGALTGAKNDDIRLETVGPSHKETEMKIAESGELLYRQPGVFVGYYKDPEKTAEVLKDGWFCSGDRCFIREDGHLVYLDRVGDVVELTNGDRLVPQWIESRLRFSPYIKDAWVFVGPKREYASVVIVINYVNVGRWAGQRRLAYSTLAELSQRPEVYDLIEKEIGRINGTLAPGSRVKKYVNLHKEFDPEEGELTRTRKLRRAFLEGRYGKLIEAIYEDKPEVSIDVEVKHRDGRRESTRTTLRIKSLRGDAS